MKQVASFTYYGHNYVVSKDESAESFSVSRKSIKTGTIEHATTTDGSLFDWCDRKYMNELYETVTDRCFLRTIKERQRFCHKSIRRLFK